MYRAIISQKTNEEPKIFLTMTGARVEFEIYNASADELKKFVGKELELNIKSVDDN